MQLFKRDDSEFWWCSFAVSGERIRLSTKRPLNDKEGAMRFMAEEYARRLNVKQFGEKPEVTLGEALDKTVKSVSGNSQKNYDLCRRKWLGGKPFKDIWCLPEGMFLSRLTQEHLDDHLDARKEEGLKANSIRAEVRFMQRACSLMGRRYAINRDLEFHKPAPFQKSRWLNEGEEQAVILALEAGLPNTTHRKALDLFIFLVDTGVRISEALGMEWADIHSNRGFIEVYRGKTKSLSAVPISERLAAVLKRLSNQKRPFMEMEYAIMLLRKVIHEECNTNPRTVEQRGAATIHTLRDTYASRLVAEGMSLHKVSKLLGHTSTTMTAKYAQLETHDVMNEARAILNRTA